MSIAVDNLRSNLSGYSINNGWVHHMTLPGVIVGGAIPRVFLPRWGGGRGRSGSGGLLVAVGGLERAVGGI